MPTYTVWSQAQTIEEAKKQLIAKAITKVHHETTSAPSYLAQVIFSNIEPGSQFIGGIEREDSHVWVRGDIRSGRTSHQRTQLLEGITNILSQILKITPDSIWVYLCELPGAAMSEYGKQLPDPGNEISWFNELPADIQQKIKSLPQDG